MDYVNKVVILGHPLFTHTHVIARVIRQTPAKLRLLYWNSRKKAWMDEDRQRAIDAHIIILGDVSSIPETTIHEISERLRYLSSDRDKRIAEIDVSYYTAVKEIKA